MRTINVEKTANGYRTTNVHGKEICRFETGNDERDHNDAQMNAHHARFSPTLAKRLNLKKKNGTYTGRPFWCVSVEATKTKNRGWIADVKVDDEVRTFRDYRTLNDLLKEIAKIGREKLTTRNILNPEAGDIEISRSEKGGCTDPGTERYHCM